MSIVFNFGFALARFAGFLGMSNALIREWKSKKNTRADRVFSARFNFRPIGSLQEECQLSLPLTKSVCLSVCLSHSVDVRVTVFITGKGAGRAQRQPDCGR
jgi:hypothetical protein